MVLFSLENPTGQGTNFVFPVQSLSRVRSSHEIFLILFKEMNNIELVVE